MSTAASQSNPSLPRRVALRPSHVLTGLATAGVLFLLAGTIPPASQRLLGIAPTPTPATPVAASAVPDVPSQVHSIAPGQVQALPGTDLIYAGIPAPTETAPADSASTDTPAATAGTDPLAPEAAHNPLIAPDTLKIWRVAELPASVPRQLYYGWAQVSVDERGVVSAAKMTESTGNAEVDAASVARLKKEPLQPARETQADGSQVPVAYTGSLFIRWVIPAS